jgi:hypothetical protein
MGRFRWAAALAAVPLLVVGCSDNGDDKRSATPRSSTTGSTVTTTTTTTTSQPSSGSQANEACELVTQQDAEAVFGETARPGVPEDAGADAVCVWQAGDDGEGPYQLLEFRLHEGSSLESRTVNTGGGTVITVQRAQGGRVFAFRYIATGSVEDAGTKQQAVDELADSVIARAD